MENRVDPKYPVRVVIVSMFDGESGIWAERMPLQTTVSFPHGYRDLSYDPERQLLKVVTGVGTAKAAASIMALGLDHRFDLSRAYWIVAGIAGGNPNTISVGSAAWAEWIVDGDLAHEIDPREIPAAWSTGRLPLFRKEPFEKPVGESLGEAYRLDPGLVDWAYELTKGISLEDSEDLRLLRGQYTAHQAAQDSPRVMKGDSISGSTLWHGKLMNEWAEQWVDYWSEGRAIFVTTAMEDTGILQALTLLDRGGFSDFRRVLVLRSVCNYSMQPSHMSAPESLAREGKSAYSAFKPALDSVFVVASRVVLEIVDNWETYSVSVPSGRFGTLPLKRPEGC
ncbi:purine nucleoside permease [Agrobacterium tumefaciens]|uniref:purine-nucleoside phosphorylase n=1 Tax=Agrobacterium tumefaciens TaxID=358 RepID=UPI001572125D|nr:purine nucleoside permease [Agrobacterium tumefaciens]NTE65153.1 purine nucleoside permease [Agrobacterium tumefaciens]